MSSTLELQPLPPAALRTTPPYFEPLSPDSRSRPPSPTPSGPLALGEGTSLKPVDGGRDAWVFLAAATGLEVLVWGRSTYRLKEERARELTLRLRSADPQACPSRSVVPPALHRLPATGTDAPVLSSRWSQVGVLHTYWTNVLFKDDHGAEATLTLAATCASFPFASLACFAPVLLP